MRAQEFTKEQWDHGTTNNMMDTTPTESGFAYDKKYGKMMPKQDDTDESPHGIFVDGKLIKTYWGREAAENIVRRDRRFRGMNVEIKPIHNEDHSSQRMTSNTMDDTIGIRETFRGNAYPTSSLYFFDVGRGGRSFTDQELEDLGLRKSLRGKWYFKPHKSHTEEQVNLILDRLSKETNVMPKRWNPPTDENDEGSGMGGFAFEQRAEQLRGKIEALETALQEKTNVKLCRSPKRLGRSDQSSCVAQGLRPHSSKGKGHTDGNGHYLKGRKAKSVHYGGDVKDYS